MAYPPKETPTQTGSADCLRGFVATIARMRMDGEVCGDNELYRMTPDDAAETLARLIREARQLCDEGGDGKPWPKVLPDKCGALLRQGVRLTGSYSPAEVLACIEEDLTAAEYDTLRGFLQWLAENGRTMGWNVQEVYAEYRAGLE